MSTFARINLSKTRRNHVQWIIDWYVEEVVTIMDDILRILVLHRVSYFIREHALTQLVDLSVFLGDGKLQDDSHEFVTHEDYDTNFWSVSWSERDRTEYTSKTIICQFDIFEDTHIRIMIMTHTTTSSNDVTQDNIAHFKLAFVEQMIK